MKTYTINLSVDTHELQQFAEWLKQQGHTVTIDGSTANKVTTFAVLGIDAARTIMSALWNNYCESV